ncbi:O-methyltransferase [Cellvibrio sp. OA-2007]|uniref:O-methyltransferase n=1 Tax=Cellvibrio sp. OA-2007 TaxID=529823 RepID=UPI0007807997|nr:O-methyltransferase [Cellvibrio sp. OA-2007]
MTYIASGDRINYSLRPAKSVERKMLKDLFSQLYPFGPVSGYKYIGFGSKYFSDFKLFHRALHINDMTSIESDVERREKYEFNKPFDCVSLLPGRSTDVLQRMTYARKFIAWLDYDAALEQSALDDLDLLIGNVFSGSVLLVTLNVIPPKIGQLREEFRSPNGPHPDLLKLKLESLVSEEFIPMDFPKARLNKVEVYSQLIRSIILNRITKTLSEKNAALSDDEKWEFEQLVYFNYKDGADMSTIGWIFFQRKDREKYNACNLTSLNFFNQTENAWNIDIPNLTTKEIRHLQEVMPLMGEIDREKLSDVIFAESDIVSFSKIYRYFPNFFDIEMA